MFSDYERLILRNYEQQRLKNALSLNLIHPTPAKLKEESLAVCSRRFRRKTDEIALNGFFGCGDEKAAAMLAIKRCDTDKFKPLVKFLRKETNTTEEKNIELLAWLIDFQLRPFELGKEYPEELKTESDKSEESENGGAEESKLQKNEFIVSQLFGEKQPLSLKVLSTAVKKPDAHLRKVFVVIGAIVITMLGVIFYLKSENENNADVFGASFTDKQCMYWAGDHYQQIACDKKIDNALVIALDTVKLRRFKKITQPDTLTAEDEGRVWYSKIDNQVEFYTTDGYHPVKLDNELKRATEHIIEKYAQPEEKQNGR